MVSNLDLNNERQFHSNISKWSKVNPKAAVFLPYLDCSHLSFCQTQMQELNLQETVAGRKHTFYSPLGAIQEVQKWFSFQSFDETDVLYIYGVGLGYHYDVIRPWLKKKRKRHLVFLEDDLAVIHRLFETKRGSQILRDHQVLLYHFESLEDSTMPLKELYWNTMTMRIAVSALPYYKKTKSERLSELEHHLAYEATMHNAYLEEYLSYGIAFFRNFYPNMLSLAGAYSGDGLCGTFRDVPAIICGAGPSLTKQLPILKKLSDHALIFAGGSAVNALNAGEIQPHLGAGIDPNPEQLKRLASNTAFEVPFLYRNRMYHPAFKLMNGPRLYFTGSGGYDISKWFEEKFQLVGEDLEEGHNVVNFCVSIAEMMQCNPIIFVGMDLAYTDKQAYAEGVTKEQVLQPSGEDLDSTALVRQDIYGKPIYTLWKWIAESKWISDFAKEYPKTTLINATEGGIGFSDIPNMPLDQAVDKYLTRQYNLKSRLHGEIQNNYLSQVTKQGLIEATEEMKNSLNRCKTSLEILYQETEQTAEKIKKEKRLPQTLQSGRAALCEIEMAEEPGYRYVLDMFNVVFTRVLTRDLQRINAAKNAPEWRKVLKRLNLNMKRLRFLQDVAVVNIQLIEEALLH